jgi:hypothetical protein
MERDIVNLGTIGEHFKTIEIVCRSYIISISTTLKNLKKSYGLLRSLIIDYNEIACSDLSIFLKRREQVISMYISDNYICGNNHMLDYITFILTIFNIDPIEDRIDKAQPQLQASDFKETKIDNTALLKLVLAPFIHFIKGEPLEFYNIDIQFLEKIVLRNKSQFLESNATCSVSNKYYHNKYNKYKNKYTQLKLKLNQITD